MKRIAYAITLLFCITLLLLAGCSKSKKSFVWDEVSPSTVKTIKLNEQDTHNNWYNLRSIIPQFSQATATQYLFGAGSRVYAYENEELAEVIKLDGYTFITGLAYNQRTAELWISAAKYKSDTRGAVLCFKESELLYEAKDLPNFDTIFFDAEDNVFFIHEEYAERGDSIHILYTEYQYRKSNHEIMPVSDRMVLSAETDGNLTAVAWCEYDEEYLAWSFNTDMHIDVINNQGELVSQVTINDVRASTPAMKFIHSNLYFSILDSISRKHEKCSKLFKLDLETQETDEVEPGSWADGEIVTLLSDGNDLYVYGADNTYNHRLQIIKNDRAVSHYQFSERLSAPQIIVREDTQIRVTAFNYDSELLIVTLGCEQSTEND